MASPTIFMQRITEDSKPTFFNVWRQQDYNGKDPSFNVWKRLALGTMLIKNIKIFLANYSQKVLEAAQLLSV